MLFLTLMFACDMGSSWEDALPAADPRDCEARSLYYLDADDDGVPGKSTAVLSCESPAGYVADPGLDGPFDCDDADASIAEGCDGGGADTGGADTGGADTGGADTGGADTGTDGGAESP